MLIPLSVSHATNFCSHWIGSRTMKYWYFHSDGCSEGGKGGVRVAVPRTRFGSVLNL